MAKRELQDVEVIVREVWTCTVCVRVPVNATREQIIARAKAKLEDKGQIPSRFSHTLDSDTWAVRDGDGNII